MEEPFRYKMAIVVRADIEMSTGKLVSQCCHACVEASEAARRKSLSASKAWRREGAKKVVLKVNSLQELKDLEGEAKKLRLPSALIVDRGLTELPPNTATALAIGPSRSGEIDKVTGKLKLL